jgi:hypothetical protein
MLAINNLSFRWQRTFLRLIFVKNMFHTLIPWFFHDKKRIIKTFPVFRNSSDELLKEPLPASPGTGLSVGAMDKEQRARLFLLEFMPLDPRKAENGLVPVQRPS